ncbi:hypothetical protein FXO38_11400 [Capsicum annuum]|nr:hypothetical protein FXO38_11400 [Capsicum annuum]
MYLEERETRKAHRKSTKFAKNRSKRDLAKIKCYRCGNLGYIAPNCKLQKSKTLGLSDDIHDQVYGLLYTSDFESDYNCDSESENDAELPTSSDSDHAMLIFMLTAMMIIVFVMKLFIYCNHSLKI